MTTFQNTNKNHFSRALSLRCRSGKSILMLYSNIHWFQAFRWKEDCQSMGPGPSLRDFQTKYSHCSRPLIFMPLHRFCFLQTFDREKGGAWLLCLRLGLAWLLIASNLEKDCMWGSTITTSALLEILKIFLEAGVTCCNQFWTQLGQWTETRGWPPSRITCFFSILIFWPHCMYSWPKQEPHTHSGDKNAKVKHV
jgi:hypothetical protein